MSALVTEPGDPVLATTPHSSGIPAAPSVAGTVIRRVSVVAVVLAAVFGMLQRIWLLVHLPLFGDESVVGLMAKQIIAGHFSTFYWGQTYGGLEPYVAALMRLVNSGPAGLNATPVLLSVVIVVLIGAIVREITGNGHLGALAAAVVWVWPYAFVWNSVREGGFRFATMSCGLGLLLCALRVQRGRRGVWTCLLLGLTAGAGWWSSPEIAYFAVPAVVLLVASARSLVRAGEGSPAWYRRPIVLIVIGAVVGALPWLYTNVNIGFTSLDLGSQVPSSGLSYSDRLSVFFHLTLPIQLGVRNLGLGTWVGGHVVGCVLLAPLLVLLLVGFLRAVRSARRGDVRLLALALGVLAFPFIYAANPPTWYWADGRYGVYLGPMIALFLFCALAPASTVEASAPPPLPVASPVSGHRHRRDRAVSNRGTVSIAVGIVALFGACVLTAAGAQIVSGTPATSPSAFFRNWNNLEVPDYQTIADMERTNIRYAYGTYWVSYNLDFLSQDRVVVSPSSLDVNRWSATTEAVDRSKRPAWLFFAPGQMTEAIAAFGNPQPGPGSYTEQEFVALLDQRGIGYRTVHLGILDAVIPNRRVSLP